MAYQRNNRLFIKVLFIGLFIAVLAYLFHPGVGPFSVMINGQPVADPLVRLAAVPTFLGMAGLAIILSVLLFLGIGFFMFLAAIFVTLIICFMMAPYFWPILVIIFLVVLLISFSHQKE